MSGVQVKRQTCNQVFDNFVAHCESRMAKNDLAFATFETYRRTPDSHCGRRSIPTHNNIVSVVRCELEYGYGDHPEKHNPASALK